jgi:hypothetical protein
MAVDVLYILFCEFSNGVNLMFVESELEVLHFFNIVVYFNHPKLQILNLFIKAYTIILHSSIRFPPSLCLSVRKKLSK